MYYRTLFFILVFPLFCQALSRPANKSVSRPITNEIKERNYRVAPLATSTQKEATHIKLILALPLENRKQALSQYGPQAFFVLKSLLVDQKESVPVRWKALTSLARLFPHQSRPLVQKALRSSSWFLQNAGLIAMEIIDPKKAVAWAGYFLDSPALVVRTAAVDMIKKHKARQYKARLLEKLNATDSFYKKESLWIRSHIVSALSVFPVPGEEPLFISFLQDPDERLHIHAILALEKLTGKTFRPHGAGVGLLAQAQKQKWIDWWAKSSYISNNSGLKM